MNNLIQAASMLISSVRSASDLLNDVNLRIQDSNPLLGGVR